MELQEKQNLLEQYYDTEDIAQRAELLSAYIEAAPEDACNALRKELFQLRYQGKLDADKFLWHYVNLAYVYKNTKSRFFKKSAQKEFTETIAQLGSSLAAAYGEAGAQVLYCEYLHAAKRFLGVCADDKSYKRRLLGLASLNDAQAREKMAKDVWVLSTGLQQAFPDAQQLLEPFAKANIDALARIDPEAARLLPSIETAESKT